MTEQQPKTDLSVAAHTPGSPSELQKLIADMDGPLQREVFSVPLGRWLENNYRTIRAALVQADSAPGMLAALREISRLTGVNDLPDARDIARAAIVKATPSAERSPVLTDRK